jgi:hypothetical protein
MEANAALRSIVRRDSGEGYREMLTRMAKESGIATPMADDLVRLDRARTGKKLSNADWCAGTAIMPRGARSITIAHACSPAWRARPSGCAPNGWSAASL